VSLPANSGKGEAVRAGILTALADRPDAVGYWDADLSTPLDAIPAFSRVLEERPRVVMVLGTRIALLGRTIRRRAWRHYAGRVFATLASLTLRLAVYDTQCGAKLFRATPELASLFATPFRSRWIFDLEILARQLRQAAERGIESAEGTLFELPLDQWIHRSGSRLRPLALPRVMLDLGRIWWSLR
jgi:hypothetical protein